MRAYAILDGGGVKGAALAGCLKAAELHGVRFEGYGGTSAGALVATLAAVGYSPDELRDIMVEEVRFTDFIDDASKELAKLRGLGRNFSWSKLLLHRGLLVRLYKELGLSTGERLTDFVKKKIGQKIPALKSARDITFQDLASHGCKPLKIVVTDLVLRGPRICSAAGGREHNGSVLEAVRASTCYPFVFKPVPAGAAYLVDGGLCSNLPVFLFDRERERDGLPVVAFDLVAGELPATANYGFPRFCRDMLDTALESGDFLLRARASNLHYVAVQVSGEISALDFDITPQQSNMLYRSGQADAHAYFTTVVPQWAQAANVVEMIQARVGIPQAEVEPALRAAAFDVERETGATGVRANVMMPTLGNKRVVVYQFGMADDPDCDLELDLTAGCSGRAWERRIPISADLEQAKDAYQTEWGMRKEQQNKVRSDRKAMISFPIFDRRSHPRGSEVEGLRLVGILSFDTDAPLSQTGWVDQGGPAVRIVEIGKKWEKILSRLLT